MRKYLIFLLLLVLFTSGCQDNADNKSNIDGGDSSYNSVVSDKNNDNIIIDIDESSLIKFNSPNSSIYNKFKPVFQEADDGKTIIANYYNDNNKLVASVYYNTNVQEYIYNDDMTLNKLAVFNSKGEYGGVIEFKYNNKLLCVGQYIYSKENALIEYQTFEYDQNNNVIKENTYDENNNLSYYNIYEYDENKNKIGSANYDANGNYITGEGTLYIKKWK